MSTPLLVVLLLLAAVPTGRLAFKRPLWKEVRSRPQSAAVALLVSVGVGVGAWILCRRYSIVLPLTVGILVVAHTAAWLRARPSWGRRRRLPPGSLGLGTSLDAIAEPDFYTEAAVRYGPVFKMAQFHRPVVCITDLRLGLQILEAHGRDLTPPRLAFGRVSPGSHVEFIEDESHPRFRSILRSTLTHSVITDCLEGVSNAIRESLDAVAPEKDGRGVRPDRYLSRVGLDAMLQVMCDSRVDVAQADLYGWFNALYNPRAFTEQGPEDRGEPYDRLVEWVRRCGAEIRDGLLRGDDVPPSVMREILRADPAHLDDDVLLGNLVLIVHVTRSNVRGLLGWILKEAVDHPEFAKELRRVAHTTPDPARVRELATHFVDETLRLHQSEYFYRELLRPLEVGGFRIPKGWLLRVCVREAHDNPAVFEDPRTFRPQRFEERSYEKTEYCPFSDGAHSRFGEGLARTIAGLFLTELALGFETEILDDGPMQRPGNRHWSHWQPSSQLRVSLTPRGRDA